MGDQDHQGSPIRASIEPLAGHFRTLNRRLWILNATLESLPGKIEGLAKDKGQSDTGISGDMPSVAPGSGASPSASTGGRFSAGYGLAADFWRLRLRRAYLRARADRADRRAARAMKSAANSLGIALEAVLLAAAARIKAEEAEDYRD